MKKRILSAILMSAVILTTACGSKTEVSEPSSQRESEVTNEAAPESTPAATTERQEQAEESSVAIESAAESSHESANEMEQAGSQGSGATCIGSAARLRRRSR